MKFADQLPNASIFVTAPGRVNLLGEHVDYNDGSVLPIAIDRAVNLAAEPLSGQRVEITALDLNQSVVFDLTQLDLKKDIDGRKLPSWAIYPAGVAWAIQKNGFSTQGFKAVFTSNIPIGAGLSSSAAVEVAFAALWQGLGGWPGDGMRLAQITLMAENQYVGLNCGLMDQFASANGVEGHALLLDTRNLNWKPIPLPAGTAIVIADSGVRRSLTSSAYNDRRAACEQAVSLLKSYLPGITALRDVSPSDFQTYAHFLPDAVRKRARHVVMECDRVDRAKELLADQDTKAFGQIMVQAHVSLRDDYEVSCPELDALVEIAMGLPGCWGARLTGAGFGGCTVNLIEERYATEFIKELKKGYLQKTGRQADVYLCHASQGVTVLKK